MQRRIIAGNLCWLDVKIGLALTIVVSAALLPLLSWLFR